MSEKGSMWSHPTAILPRVYEKVGQEIGDNKSPWRVWTLGTTLSVTKIGDNNLAIVNGQMFSIEW